MDKDSTLRISTLCNSGDLLIDSIDTAVFSLNAAVEANEDVTEYASLLKELNTSLGELWFDHLRSVLVEYSELKHDIKNALERIKVQDEKIKKLEILMSRKAEVEGEEIVEIKTKILQYAHKDRRNKLCTFLMNQ